MGKNQLTGPERGEISFVIERSDYIGRTYVVLKKGEVRPAF